MRKLEVQIYGFVSYVKCGTFKVAMQLKTYRQIGTL